jgi:hypothetical protein
MEDPEMTAAESLLQAPEPPLSTCSIPDDDQSLRDAITRLAGHINAAEYRFLKLLAALLERAAWLGDSGFKTPAHWLNYYSEFRIMPSRAGAIDIQS